MTENRATVNFRCPCPGCGNEAEGEKWAKNDFIYETIACGKCQVEWAQMNGGEWFVLRKLDNRGLKISRRP